MTLQSAGKGGVLGTGLAPAFSSAEVLNVEMSASLQTSDVPFDEGDGIDIMYPLGGRAIVPSQWSGTILDVRDALVAA